MPEGATLGALKEQIAAQLGVAVADQVLSLEQGLLTAVESGAFGDLQDAGATLKQLGVRHGAMVFLKYDFVREVASTVPKHALETRTFGDKMTMDDLIALQTRIDRQEKPKVASLSLDRRAANVFQGYISQALQFSIKRGGIMYGTVNEELEVRVDFIYEPPQDNSKTGLALHTATEEQEVVDKLAEILGLKKVGLIFSQSTAEVEQEHLLSTGEIVTMGRMQAAEGETFTTAVVSLTEDDEGAVQISFKAYQCSEQCAGLVADGWFEGSPLDTGVSELTDPRDPKIEKPVVVAGRDAKQVDNEWFLCPVKILDHEGPLRCDFPVENRLTAQGKAELKSYLRGEGSMARAMADFHVLLYLAKQPNFDFNDITLLAAAVASGEEIGEGYRLIIEGYAGM